MKQQGNTLLTIRADVSVPAVCTTGFGSRKKDSSSFLATGRSKK
jgi:hypothetical protein